MCGYGGIRQKDDCNQVAHLQYCVFVELKFFNKLQIMLKKVIKNHTKSHKKLSTFVGDSTYTNAPPTHRSPLRSNNHSPVRLVFHPSKSKPWTKCEAHHPLPQWHQRPKAFIEPLNNLTLKMCVNSDFVGIWLASYKLQLHSPLSRA
jgi:hypothetical protein